MRKILFVIPSLEVGGTVSSLSSIIDYISNDYEVRVLALAHDGNVNVTFKKYLLPQKFLLHSYYCCYSQTRGLMRILIGFIKILKRICNTIKYDPQPLLFRIHSLKYNDFDIYIGFQEGNSTNFVSHIRGKCKYAWVHCDYKNYPNCGNELSIYQRFNSIICVSQYTTMSFLSVYPELINKVQYIHNLININNIRTLSLCEIDDVRFTSSGFTILSVGRIHEVKRFHYIPQIASQLIKNGCSFKWFIIGPEFNDESYVRLMQNIYEYEVSDNVIYLGNKSNPYPYFMKSNLLVSLSSTEACPMIFNEAKVLNLPIVTTDFGSAYEFVEDGKNGIITSLHDISSILYKLLTDANFYCKLNGNHVVADSVNKDMLSKLHELFV